jgi:hypothetical protein
MRRICHEVGAAANKYAKGSVELPRACDPRRHEQARAHQAHAAADDDPRAMTVHDPPDGRAENGGNQEAKGKSPSDKTLHVARGHNWKGGGTVDGTRSLDVMKLARAGYLTGSQFGSGRWSYRDSSALSVSVTGGREAIRLDYRIRTRGEEWQLVSQRIPIRWTSCRFGGERPWFVCDVYANGVYCGRRVAKLYHGGRLFACRRCYRLVYAIQRGGPMDRAHHNLGRLHRKPRADYDRPDMPPPPRPKWMRWKTYSRIARQLEAGQERLDVVFTIGAQRLLGRLEKSQQPRRNR